VSKTFFFYLDWLTRDRINRASGSDLEFVKYHVSQTLVVNNAYVNVRGKLLSGDA